MNISSLDRKTYKPDIVLLQTGSVKLRQFLQDRVKRKYQCSQESVIEVSGKHDLKAVREVIGTSPPFSDRWYVGVDLSKVSVKDLLDLVKISRTCVFFCECAKYSLFKDLKSKATGVAELCDLYLTYLRRADFVYLYDAFVPQEKRLSKTLLNYVYQGYANDIDAVISLFQSIASGVEYTTRSQIADLCGIGGLNIETFIFDLVKPLSGSDRGLKMVLRNRIKYGLDLGQMLGYRTLYGYMSRSLLLLCQLKSLILAGVVYKTVRGLPDTYDEVALARYQRYIYRLNEVPLSELLRLREYMGFVAWSNDLDFFRFLYTYYGEKVGVLTDGGVM